MFWHGAESESNVRLETGHTNHCVSVLARCKHHEIADINKLLGRIRSAKWLSKTENPNLGSFLKVQLMAFLYMFSAIGLIINKIRYMQLSGQMPPIYVFDMGYPNPSFIETGGRMNCVPTHVHC